MGLINLIPKALWKRRVKRRRRDKVEDNGFCGHATVISKQEQFASKSAGLIQKSFLTLSVNVAKTLLLTVENLCVQTTRCDTGFLSECLHLTLVAVGVPVQRRRCMRVCVIPSFLSGKPHEILTKLAGQFIWKSATMLIYVWAPNQLRLVIKVRSWEEAPKVCLPAALRVFHHFGRVLFFF